MGENDCIIFLRYELQCGGKGLLHVEIAVSWVDVQAFF